jgi:hypothetical protein
MEWLTAGKRRMVGKEAGRELLARLERTVLNWILAWTTSSHAFVLGLK